jgi:metallo-beta-lactamase family protein
MSVQANDSELQFLGAAGTVTGSKLLVRHRGQQTLVDCGLYQGLRELRRRNWQPPPFDPADVSAVLLTHAHLDHCGYLPALVRAGFRGAVHSTRATAALARIVLLDSAHLLEEEAEHARTHGWSKHASPRPLYDTQDVQAALELLRVVEYDTPTPVGDDAVATFRRAGHILGSASVHLDLPGADTSVLVSGDLGRGSHPLLRPPQPPTPARHIVVESTYGDRRHDDDGTAALGETIRRTVRRGGTVVIPAFAVDRTELVLHALRQLRLAGELPDVPVYVDSPMALRALDVYRQALAEGDDVRPDLMRHGDPFDPGRLTALRTPQESMAVNAPAWPCVVVSASGMATGGRVLHHLEHLMPDPRHTVVLVGYQAVGTRGRALADGARELKIHGRYVPVRCEVVQVPGFSVHADADELLAWLGACPRPPACCFVVHGEPAASAALAGRIRDELGWTAVVPEHGDRRRIGRSPARAAATGGGLPARR